MLFVMVCSLASSPATAAAETARVIFGAGAARVALSIDDCVGGAGCRTDHHRRKSRFCFCYFY